MRKKYIIHDLVITENERMGGDHDVYAIHPGRSGVALSHLSRVYIAS